MLYNNLCYVFSVRSKSNLSNNIEFDDIRDCFWCSYCMNGINDRKSFISMEEINWTESKNN